MQIAEHFINEQHNLTLSLSLFVCFNRHFSR